MTGFMFVLLVAMLLGIILMYIIDCHMAKTADRLFISELDAKDQIQALCKLQKHWLKSTSYGAYRAELHMYKCSTKWYQRTIEKYYYDMLNQHEKKHFKKIIRRMNKYD